jgi:hypothetical protein
MEEKSECKAIIYSKSGKLEISSTEMLNFHSTASVKAYCAIFELTFKSPKKEISDLIEPKQEIEVWTGKKEELHKIMAGYIDKIMTEKKENSDEVMRIIGRSYDALLVDTKISGKIVFEEGYSQVIRMLFKSMPFTEGEVVGSSEKGIIFFRNIAIIEIIKNIADYNGWAFRLDYDKRYYFTPSLPQTNIPTLGSKDIKSYKFVRE